MTPEWVKDAVFYHIYPLGLCGAPQHNDDRSAPIPRLNRVCAWIDHLETLGVNAVLFGPLLESTSHGYNTVDLFQLDRRLGTTETLQTLITALKRRGFRVVFDAVFNHVGRDFWAFRDVLQHGRQSAYVDWFAQIDFERTSPYGDPFAYAGWAGHYDLVKLNLGNPAVREHLFAAVRWWMEQFDIDGLRLDAADHIAIDFFSALKTHCRQLKADCWLLGEVVHGDYTRWTQAERLDATTNYECYKGLYSSHVDHNYFEIAYSLNRQFGTEGLYRDLYLYNFVDNHDVNRIASSLSDPAHLYTVYGLLFTMPGIPSIYYGSEWGIEGKRTPHSDYQLRPALDLRNCIRPEPQLADAIRRFAAIRHAAPALKYGSYRQVHVASEQFAFARTHQAQQVIVAVNAAAQTTRLTLRQVSGCQLIDLLNEQETFAVIEGQADIDLYGHWLRILQVVT